MAKKLLAIGGIIFFSTLLLVKGIMPGCKTIHSDFANYYVSAKLIADGENLSNIYDNTWFQQKIKSYGIDTPGKFAPFPPITAWWLLPLTPFSPLHAQQIFTLLNLAFLLLSFFLIKKITSWPWLYSVLLPLACGWGLINNFAFGQVYLIMAVAILASIYLIQINHAVLPGILLGYFTCLKYFPLIIIFAILINGILAIRSTGSKISKNNLDLRIVLWSCITIIILCLCQYLYFGRNVVSEFIYSALLPHLDGNLTGQGLFSYHFQSWDNLFRNIFTLDSKFNPDPILNWPEGRVISKLIISCLTTVLLGWSLFNTRLLAIEQRRGVYISLCSLASLVMLPASATYHFILLIPALLFLPDESILTKNTMLCIGISYVLIGIIPYGLAFRLGNEVNILLAYPRLWLVTLLFLLTTFGIHHKKIRSLNDWFISR